MFCNFQALVPSPSLRSPQAQPQPSPTQFETQMNPKGTGADTKILLATQSEFKLKLDRMVKPRF